MLVLSRTVGGEIVIDHCIRVRVLGLSRGRVKLGITAPANVSVRRDELRPLASSTVAIAASSLPTLGVEIAATAPPAARV